MELIWATESLVIGGRPYMGFPILLWDSMDSCTPANDFFRHYLLRGAIGSKRSWPSTGRALYDYFSFLQAHDLQWTDVDRGEEKSLVAGYRDYCMTELLNRDDPQRPPMEAFVEGLVDLLFRPATSAASLPARAISR